MTDAIEVPAPIPDPSGEDGVECELRVYGWRLILSELPFDLRQDVEKEIAGRPSTDGIMIELFGDEVVQFKALAEKHELDENTIDPDQFAGNAINKRTHAQKND